MSTANRRRNGSQASCEPCRKGKVRCDHRRPACSRCTRRGNPSKCWYHPAPLTKHLISPVSETPLPSSSPETPLENTDVELLSSSVPGDKEDHAPLFHSWPVLSNDGSDIKLRIIFKGIRDPKIYEEQIVTTREILGPLRHLDELEQLVIGYYELSQTARVPKPIALRMISLLKDDPMVSKYIKGDYNETFVAEFAKSLIRACAMPVKIAPDTTPEDFCAKYSGMNLRIETIGIISTLAARSFLSKNGHIDVGTDQLAANLVRCSNLSLRLSREQAAQNNDVIVWLAFENIQLMSHVKGDTSLSVWRRVNDLITDVIAVGLHRDATSCAETVPFFLAESRRNVFVATYHLDKLFAALFTRPVGLSSRYVDCKMPMDLSDDEVFADPNGTHDPSRFAVDSDGWNTDRKARITSWARARYVLAILREEVVDYQLRSVTASDIPKLRDLKRRCAIVWNAIPAYLRYTPDCWTAGDSIMVCTMKSKVYLLYLHIHFQINRIIGKLEGDMLPGLVPTSFEIIEVLIERAKVRNCSVFLPHDLPGILLGYGVPAAMVLAIGLQNTIRNPSANLADGVRRSAVLNCLCVFVSQLDSVSNHPHPNHDFCKQAAKGLNPILDKILGGSTETPTYRSAQDIGDPSQDSSLAPEVPFTAMGFNVYGLQDLDSLDFENWVAGMDWAATGEWNPT